MMKKPVILISVFILLAALLSPFTVYGERPLELYTGDNKQFSLTDLKGNTHALPDYKGKVVLINFWASWCPPCIYEMPELQRLKKHFAERPFEVITINVGEKKYKVRKFVKLINLDLPVLLDTSSETFDDWGVKTLPTSFIIDSEGKIRYQVRGDPGWETEETRTLIEEMLP
jgi:thiol-disulfide isomerase/thioredoxin